MILAKLSDKTLGQKALRRADGGGLAIRWVALVGTWNHVLLDVRDTQLHGPEINEDIRTRPEALSYSYALGANKSKTFLIYDLSCPRFIPQFGRFNIKHGQGHVLAHIRLVRVWYIRSPYKGLLCVYRKLYSVLIRK